VKVPTIRGTVGVEFECRKGEFVLEVEIPANSSARVVLPGLGEGQVEVDGELVEGEPMERGVAVDPIGGGWHRLVRCC